MWVNPWLATKLGEFLKAQERVFPISGDSHLYFPTYFPTDDDWSRPCHTVCHLFYLWWCRYSKCMDINQLMLFPVNQRNITLIMFNELYINAISPQSKYINLMCLLVPLAIPPFAPSALGYLNRFFTGFLPVQAKARSSVARSSVFLKSPRHSLANMFRWKRSEAAGAEAIRGSGGMEL